LPLETLAVGRGAGSSGSSDTLLALAEEVGVARVTALGAMQAPSPALHHGGRPRIAEFVRWLEAESVDDG
ncbi:MAG: hypothetical protein JOY59_11970, partial [Candidatus Eremiobacteraeota bacterium]|nr:hypothetical protein [Candidatus Eremiobacteraeota bacterium]